MTDRRSTLDARARFDERAARQLRTMAPGNPDGRFASAAAVPPARPRPELYRAADVLSIPPFSLGGEINLDESGRWYPPRFVHIVKLSASLDTAGSSSTVVVVRKNGVAITGGTLTLGSGVNLVTATIDETLDGPDTDYLTVETTTAGTGAADLVVQIAADN